MSPSHFPLFPLIPILVLGCVGQCDGRLVMPQLGTNDRKLQVVKRRTFSPCHRSRSRAHTQTCVGHSTFSSKSIVKKRFGFVMKRKFSAASAKAKDGGAPVNVSQVRVG